MQTENLFNLKIHKLSQEQYDRELVAGTLDEHALYITPDENYTNNFSSVLVGSETISAADSEGILVIGYIKITLSPNLYLKLKDRV